MLEMYLKVYKSIVTNEFRSSEGRVGRRKKPIPSDCYMDIPQRPRQQDHTVKRENNKVETIK
jgi:hypothetical protein